MTNHDTPCIYNMLPFEDKRGALRQYGMPEFEIKECYVVENNARTFRGMHLQNMDNPQRKIVGCLSGEVFDYVMDVREDSPTFLEVFRFHLSRTNEYLYIPAGYAHGYFSRKPSTLLYLMDAFFDPDCYSTINIYSVESISLPEDIIISDKDANAKSKVDYARRKICW